eukprot:TRINITY_DN15241_c0_g5_i1.p2 TRINITY_DN15241_c0_g5~~TRINITY_DN15241_c0_g5_i1.p2  ORF type:complete len:100 (+),score=20.97 TRINITY_DN15241_c0_g5_i1:372-671(+)
MECIICEIELKDMDHWDKHMKSLAHKDNVKNYTAREKQTDDGFKAPAPRKPKAVSVEETVEKAEEPKVEEVVDKGEEAAVAGDSVLPQVLSERSVGFLC